jgi:hypothetical protein
MAELAKKIKENFKSLYGIRLPREAVWDDIIQYIIPGLEVMRLNDIDKPGARTGIKRFDGTGVSALQLFADGLFGYLISPSIAWLRFNMKEEIMQIAEVREWLQDVEAYYYEIFNKTNFYDSMSTYFEYVPALGFGCMYLEEDMSRDQPVFHVYHPGGVYVRENICGYVDTVYREEKIQAGIAVKKFGKENVSQALAKAADDNEFQEFEFIHAVFPKEDFGRMGVTSIKKPFASIWLEKDGDPRDTNGKVVREKGYNRFPYMVWRFKKGTTAYGSGPAEEALVEVMGANAIQKSLLKAAQKSIEPPMNVPSEMAGMVDLTPNGMNFYTDPNKRIYPVDRGVDFPIGIDREERIQRAIERHFKVEFFTLLSNLSIQEGSRRTATEIIELQGEKAAVLGRPINKLNKECLMPIIDNIWDMENEAGRLPLMPPIIEDLQGENVDVEFMGPLAQAQRKLFETQGINVGLEQLAMLAQVKGPEVLDWVNGDATAKKILFSAGFQQDSMNTKDAVDKIRQGRMQAQMREQQQEAIMNAMDSAKTLAEADKASGGKITEGFDASTPA